MGTYRGSPVFAFRPDWSEMTARQLDELRIESAGAGIAVPWSAGTAIRRRGEFSVVLDGAGEIAEMVAFFDERKGRRKGFWVPTWLGDFRLLADAAAGASELVIEAIGLAGLIAECGEQFRHLAIVRDSAWVGVVELELHRVASVAVVGESEVLTLEDSLGAAIDRRRTLCSPLLFARFGTDELDLMYESDGVARASVAVTELPTEYGEPHEGDAPIWLYEFARRGETIRVADWGEDVERDGVVWEAASISHDEIRSNAELLFSPIEIRATGERLRGLAEAAPEPVGIRILRVDADPAVAAVLEFAGELTGRAVRSAGGIVFSAETSLGAAAGEDYPRSGYDRYDNGHVYDQLDESVWTTYDTVSSIGPDWIEASGFAAKAASEDAPQWFAGGVVRIGDQERYCRYQDGARLYLSRGFDAVSVGAAVSASAGYDRSLTMRAERFGDAANHRGFAYMPDRNLLFEPLEVAQSVSARKK